MVDDRLQPVGAPRLLDALGELEDGELLGELVEDAELAGLGRAADGQLDAAHRVADVEEAARLAALAVNGEGMVDGRL